LPTESRENALFEEQYESICGIFRSARPRLAITVITTSLEYSLEAIAEREKINQDFLARVQAFRAWFFGPGSLSHDLMVRVLQQRIADFN